MDGKAATPIIAKSFKLHSHRLAVAFRFCGYKYCVIYYTPHIFKKIGHCFPQYPKLIIMIQFSHRRTKIRFVIFLNNINDYSNKFQKNDIPNMFTDKEIQAFVLQLYYVNAHSNQTLLDAEIKAIEQTFSVNYTKALYSEYISDYNGTDKKYTLNKNAYSYLYNA